MSKEAEVLLKGMQRVDAVDRPLSQECRHVAGAEASRMCAVHKEGAQYHLFRSFRPLVAVGTEARASLRS